jgi:hypothetical protein
MTSAPSGVHEQFDELSRCDITGQPIALLARPHVYDFDACHILGLIVAVPVPSRSVDFAMLRTFDDKARPNIFDEALHEPIALVDQLAVDDGVATFTMARHTLPHLVVQFFVV